MFTVLFEVQPDPARRDQYLDIAKSLKSDLVKMDGFIDNIRYASLTREGWILSLSTWENEKALVRWRTQEKHHRAQEKGREEVLLDYRLRICEITRDTHPPKGIEVQEQRFDLTTTGDAKAALLVSLDKSGLNNPTAQEALDKLGLKLDQAQNLVGWDIYNSVLTPGDIIAYLAFKDADAANDFDRHLERASGLRSRQQRVIRDYGMFQRTEAPQYYPDKKQS